MKKFILATVILVLSFLLTACPKYSVQEGSFDPVRIRDQNFPGTTIRWNNVSIVDPGIKNKIFVETTNSRRSPTGTLEVWVILRNRTDYPIQIEARTSFYDATQAPVEQPTAWKRLLLTANSTGHYKEMSATLTEIGYYHIEVREGR
ncbi:hypothetical protein QUF90_12250 [Desulfococcaceae bacterium HSG9]|nr:hypothetical protein [Desulfococcaceae bacterium HSG9]